MRKGGEECEGMLPAFKTALFSVLPPHVMNI